MDLTVLFLLILIPPISFYIPPLSLILLLLLFIKKDRDMHSVNTDADSCHTHSKTENFVFNKGSFNDEFDQEPILNTEATDECSIFKKGKTVIFNTVNTTVNSEVLPGKNTEGIVQCKSENNTMEDIIYNKSVNKSSEDIINDKSMKYGMEDAIHNEKCTVEDIIHDKFEGCMIDTFLSSGCAAEGEVIFDFDGIVTLKNIDGVYYINSNSIDIVK